MQRKGKWEQQCCWCLPHKYLLIPAYVPLQCTQASFRREISNYLCGWPTCAAQHAVDDRAFLRDFGGHRHKRTNPWNIHNLRLCRPNTFVHQVSCPCRAIHDQIWTSDLTSFGPAVRILQHSDTSGKIYGPTLQHHVWSAWLHQPARFWYYCWDQLNSNKNINKRQRPEATTIAAKPTESSSWTFWPSYWCKHLQTWTDIHVLITIRHM